MAWAVGIGWDFSLTSELKLRPIANFTLGHMTRDLSAATRIIEGETNQEMAFLVNGRLNSGFGHGTISARFRPESGAVGSKLMKVS